ncbi:hypothetical protein ABB29_07435 [Pseudoxanthomonas dokdonensis]|uniref:Protein BatD n=2 Tax=Pseudoxanthomonas dokdonensis TaxID=344882 RepID=A0A0R0CUP3_9GAMM|nr:hypothetical protein ABB29_07435 [Pseudoxanthomonas dokdonensis]
MLLICVIPLARAETSASLDRSSVALGESVTLTVQTDQLRGSPDLTPLLDDFALQDQSTRRSVQNINGNFRNSTTYEIVLAPKRSGELVVPALTLGNQRTAPLRLKVGEGRPVISADSAAQRGDSTFVEVEVDDPTPYVQQSVGVTLRLYYAVPLASGQLELDSPDGALLQKIGDDVQSSRNLAGRHYNVVERRFLLVPDHSGKLVLPAARFNGRGAGGWMDDFFGGNSRDIRAAGSAQTLQVKPLPANAPQPWLPLTDLKLRYLDAPQSLRAGQAAKVTIEAVASGATQSQLPELSLPAPPGAQVFAEPPQFNERFIDGRPQVSMTRSFSIVPNQPGRLDIAGLRIGWWRVGDDSPQQAVLPDLTLKVLPGSGGFATPAPAATTADVGSNAASAATSDDRIQLRQPVSRVWIWLSAGFAILWLLTLLWALLRRPAPVLAHGGKSSAATARVPTARPRHALADLKRVLDTGDLDEVAEVLKGMASPPLRELDALSARLSSPDQRAAIETLRRARWADGDAVSARHALRQAFRDGPQWRVVDNEDPSPLPPLYPQR